MTSFGHLWAIGYDDIARASQVRDEIVTLGWDKSYLILDDVAVVVRHPDGSFTLDREPFPVATNLLGCTAVGFLAGLVLGAPLVGAAVGALTAGVGTAVAAAAGIDEEFIRQVEALMKPGTSALFVLDDEGDMDIILHAIRGLGGTVLKTNVDVERAKLIQSTLAAAPAPTRQPGAALDGLDEDQARLQHREASEKDPRPAAMTGSEFRFTSRDGLRIACARWDARAPARGVIQIAHGMGEHIGRYAELIEALVEAGLTVYGNDHRGHGRTAPSATQLGDFGEGGFDLLVEDMARLSRIAKDQYPDQPLMLLGHSMGSFAAQQYVVDNSREIDGLILSGSGDLDGLARLARSAPAGKNILNAPFEPARTPFDWLSRDTAVVDGFSNDPLCFAELQPAAYASFLAAAPRLADPLRLRQIRQDLPIYLFSGSEDPVGQQGAGVRRLIERYRQAGIRNIIHDFYPGGRHEMLNEVNRTEVRTRLLGWVFAVLDRRDVELHPGQGGSRG